MEPGKVERDESEMAFTEIFIEVPAAVKKESLANIEKGGHTAGKHNI